MKIPRSRRRGKSKVFRANAFRAVGISRLIRSDSGMNGRVTKLIHDVYRTSPLMEVKFEDGQTTFLPAFSGAYVGKNISYLKPEMLTTGSIQKLGNIPPGTDIYDVELKPGDGGKIVRAGGTSAKVMEVSQANIAVSLPSGSMVRLNPECRAIIGRIANAGRKEKPFYKAGNKYHLIYARARYWPMTAAVAMNAYEHKFGGKRRSTQHKSKSASRRAPPGAKVGSIAPKRTGMKR
ncbi:MAG: 50S ribosomal protein L2 [Candidatus Parvarchaeota archaeon]|jgi:large subunit ribosomal protein L2|nr:50S ribosomal protein L2 [Candidatus Parvarchaeota archaeon]